MVKWHILPCVYWKYQRRTHIFELNDEQIKFVSGGYSQEENYPGGGSGTTTPEENYPGSGGGGQSEEYPYR